MDMIRVEHRDARAKAKQLRRNGIVPGCVYGGSLQNPISIQMSRQSANQLFSAKREGSKVNLELDGQVIPVQIKEKTRNVLDHEVLHFGFEALASHQKVNSVAHILLKNTDVIPGILEQMIFEIPFSSLPADMIDTVTIDLKDLSVGTTLTVNDIPDFQNDRVKSQIDMNSIVLRIVDKKRILTPTAQ